MGKLIKNTIEINLMIDQLICENRYLVTNKLGSGSFGDVYEVQDIRSTQFFAAKFEKTGKNAREVKFMKRFKGIAGVPQIYEEGQHENEDGVKYDIVVMDKLGKNLETKKAELGGKIEL